MPLFLRGNSTHTIPQWDPHCFRNLLCSEFPNSYADVDESGRKGSNVYEVNQWLCRFGRGKPRLGGLSVSETEVLQMAAMQEGVGVVMPPGPNGGAMTQTLRRPSEAKNESGLTRKDIHGLTMVVPKYDKISQEHFDLC